MNLVTLLKEKGQQIQFNNGEFIKRFEPQVREFKESLNQSFPSSVANFVARIRSLTDNDTLLELIPSFDALKLYNKLKPNLGQEIHLSDWYCVDQKLIDDFAELTGDKQWIHVDVERAKKESPFRGTIAHGFLVLSLIPRLRGLEHYAAQHYPEAKAVINRGLRDVDFIAPIKSGQKVRSRSILRELSLHKRGVDILEEVIIEVGENSRRSCVAGVVTRLYV